MYIFFNILHITNSLLAVSLSISRLRICWKIKTIPLVNEFMKYFQSINADWR